MRQAMMARGQSRPLTDGERASLTPGLAQALDAAGVEPLIVARAALPARIAALWRGGVPILTWGPRIFWPRVPRDLSQSPRMAILQHELQHVLDYATGALTPLGYVANPRNWTYSYRLGEASAWSRFGAEQRAQIVEDYWRLERAGQAADHHRRVIPWVVTPLPAGEGG